jgi:hypothetical protein
MNTGKQPLSFLPDGVQVEASDGLGYLANPDLGDGWPPQGLGPGQEAAWTSVFLVPRDAALSRLSFGLADGRRVSLNLPAH